MLVLWIILLSEVSGKLCKCVRPLKKFSKLLRDKLKWNSIIRLLMIGYLGYATTSFTVMSGASADSNLTSLIVSGLLTVLVIAFPIWFYLFLKKNEDSLKTNKWKATFGSLTLNLDTEWKTSRYFILLGILRRFMFSLTIFTPSVQL